MSKEHYNFKQWYAENEATMLADYRAYLERLALKGHDRELKAVITWVEFVELELSEAVQE